MDEETEAMRARIMAATTRPELDAIILELDGLDSVNTDNPADDTTTTVEEARAICLERL